MDRLAQLIDAQRALQLALGFDVKKMSDAERVQYIHANATNAMLEVGEALGEVNWKPWSSGAEVHEEAYFGELRDAWQHLTNLMLAAYPWASPEQLAALLSDKVYEKHIINYERIRTGYDGRSNKCSRCKRALDDVAVTCTADACHYE